MRRFVLSVIACLVAVLFMAHAVDPVPVAAPPRGCRQPRAGRGRRGGLPRPARWFFR